MKGVSNWIWIVCGILVAVISFTIAYNQIQQTNHLIAEQRGIGYFKDISSNLDNLCSLFVDNKRVLTVNLGETIEGIYAAKTPYEEYERAQLINNILSNKNATGTYLCLKITGKRLDCKEFSCNVTFPFIGYVPQEFSLSALINSLMGRGLVYTYFLNLIRTSDKLDVVRVGYEPNQATTTIGPGSTTTSPSTTSSSTTTTSIPLLTADNLIDCIVAKSGTLYTDPPHCSACRRQETLFLDSSVTPPPVGPATKWDNIPKFSSGSPCGAIPCWTLGTTYWAGCYNLPELNTKYSCNLQKVSGYNYVSC